MKLKAFLQLPKLEILSPYLIVTLLETKTGTATVINGITACTGTTGDTLTTGDGITGVGITTTGIILLFIMALGLDNYLNQKQDQDLDNLNKE